MIPAFDHTAPYIWASFGFAAVVLLGLTAGALIRARRAKARLDRLEEDGA